jgi:fumarate reductase subunit D
MSLTSEDEWCYSKVSLVIALIFFAKFPILWVDARWAKNHPTDFVISHPQFYIVLKLLIHKMFALYVCVLSALRSYKQHTPRISIICVYMSIRSIQRSNSDTIICNVFSICLHNFECLCALLTLYSYHHHPIILPS